VSGGLLPFKQDSDKRERQGSELTRRRLPAFSLTLILVGGWMIAQPGLILVAPFVVAAGLVGGGFLTRTTPAQGLVVQAGCVIGLLLLFGAILQWRADPDADSWRVAFGFSGAFLLSVMTAALPKETLRRGLTALHGLALASSLYMGIAASTLSYRAAGLFGLNPNAAAGFCLFAGLHWLLSDPSRRWTTALWSGIAMSGVIFSGSRWAVVVLMVSLAVLLMTRRVRLQGIAIIAAVLLLALLSMSAPAAAFRVGSPTETATAAVNDAATRQQISASVSFAPYGYLGGEVHGHQAMNLFARAAIEAGWLGLAVLLAVLFLAYRRARWETMFLLSALMALSLMDIYTWWPFQLVPLFWAVIGLSVSEREVAYA
jgi:hypothetical protein